MLIFTGKDTFPKTFPKTFPTERFFGKEKKAFGKEKKLSISDSGLEGPPKIFVSNIFDVCYYCYACLGFTRHPLRHSCSVAIFVILTLPCRIDGVSMRFDVAPLLEIFFGPRSHYIYVEKR